MNVIGYTIAELSPTKSYGRRVLLWIPGDAWYEPLGFLTLRLWRGESFHGKDECQEYQVEETDNVGNYPGRTFVVKKLHPEEGEDDLYLAHIPFRETDLSTCTCKAARCKVPADQPVTDGCRHRDALRHLMAEGVI